MRFASYKHNGRTSYGLAVTDGLIDLASRLPAYPTLKSLIEAGLPDNVIAPFRSLSADISDADIQYLPPIPDPTHFWCLALNYAEHHTEVESAGRMQELPKQPALFARFADSVTGHSQNLYHPGVSEQFDYEGELGVVIGKAGRNISESEAFSHIIGYTIINEGSVRDWQFHTRQITPGKNFYHSGAVGPYLVTTDEITNVYDLSIRTVLNGKLMQDGNTRDMLHKIERFIAYVSAISPLSPGDVLATGTPSGVGFSRQPPLWMKPGDICDISITGLGTLSNVIGTAS